MNTRPNTYLKAQQIKRMFSSNVIWKVLNTSLKRGDSYWSKIYMLALGKYAIKRVTVY